MGLDQGSLEEVASESRGMNVGVVRWAWWNLGRLPGGGGGDLKGGSQKSPESSPLLLSPLALCSNRTDPLAVPQEHAKHVPHLGLCTGRSLCLELCWFTSFFGDFFLSFGSQVELSPAQRGPP